jgi:hypothetical protein
MISTHYSVLRTDGSEILGVVEWPEEPSYDQIAKLVVPRLDGHPLEHVTILSKKLDRVDMFVAEDGHIYCRELARNERATEEYRRNWLTRHPGCDPESLPYIIGPAVLFHRRVWY